MKSQGKYHLIGDRSLEEGDQVEVDQSLVRGLLRKRPKNRKHSLNKEKLDQLTHILWGAWLQGVGEEVHHQVGEALQMIEEMMNQMRRKMRRMILMKKLYQ